MDACNLLAILNDRRWRFANKVGKMWRIECHVRELYCLDKFLITVVQVGKQDGASIYLVQVLLIADIHRLDRKFDDGTQSTRLIPYFRLRNKRKVAVSGGADLGVGRDL